jgi:NADPH:quinone reductase-like Zn-dependent oxidoreductase
MCSKDAESGAFGEYIIAKGDLLARIPDDLSFEAASTLAVGIMTCGQSLYQLLSLPLPTNTYEERSSSNKPRAIFIYGGSTASGIFGIQFAKLSGLVVLTTASPHNFEYLRSLGADAVFDYHSDVETLASEIRKHTNGNLTITWDCRPGADSGRLCALAMSDRDKGMYATLQPRTPRDYLHGINPMVDAYFTIGYTVFGEPFTRAGRRYEARPEDAAFAKDFWELSQKLLVAGKIKIPRLEINRGGGGLLGMVQGLEDLRLGQVSGRKLVYTF